MSKSSPKRKEHLKNIHKEKVRETTKKIEIALAKLPKVMQKPSLLKVIKFVSEETGVHFTTIYKNENYKEMCRNAFLLLSLGNVKSKKRSPKDFDMLEKKNRLLALENANLKNQINSLTNAIKKMSADGGSSDESVYKERFEALLSHFKDQVEIVDGKVIDPYAGIRSVEICKVD